MSAAIAAALCASPAAAQPEHSDGFEVQLGVLTPTSAFGTAEGYRVRLGAAPTVGLAWHRAGLNHGHIRVPFEATLHLSGSASPTAVCVGYCQRAGFTALSTSLGADLVLAPRRGRTAAAYFALGARARAYVASAACPAAPGAFCPGTDPLTAPGIRPALALAAGTQPRVGGARRVSIEVGYLPTWLRGGRVQHDVRAVLGTRL